MPTATGHRITVQRELRRPALDAPPLGARIRRRGSVTGAAA
jgi:hypothetical protein